MRSSVKLDGTNSSNLTTNTYNPESLKLCYKWRPDKELLDLSKKATMAYNNEQTQKQHFVFDCYLSQMHLVFDFAVLRFDFKQQID